MRNDLFAIIVLVGLIVGVCIGFQIGYSQGIQKGGTDILYEEQSSSCYHGDCMVVVTKDASEHTIFSADTCVNRTLTR